MTGGTVRLLRLWPIRADLTASSAPTLWVGWSAFVNRHGICLILKIQRSHIHLRQVGTSASACASIRASKCWAMELLLTGHCQRVKLRSDLKTWRVME